MTLVRFVLLCSFCLPLFVGAAPLSPEDAVSQARTWMQSNPIMEKVSDRPVRSFVHFPAGTNYVLYVVSLDPSGYLILESDDQVPLVFSFSPDATVNLSESSENALPAMLRSHGQQVEEMLEQPKTTSMATVSAQAATEIHGPFLETLWNQCNPYNQLCPEDPDQTNTYYYGRDPVGCVPASYAQIMAFHQWPPRGRGSHSYTDSEGNVTGFHIASFSDPYDWDHMQDIYSYATNTNPAEAEAAVAELMYELGVAVEANYDTAGTSSSVETLGKRLPEFFFFESSYYEDNVDDLIPPMQADLRAGRPCIVSIPNHAIVADGLMVDSGETFYHFNFGWGGNNDGWFTLDTLGYPLQSGETGLRPYLMAFPETNTVTASDTPLNLRWIFPKRREAEIDQFDLYQLEGQTSEWYSDGETLPASLNAGWRIDSAGHSGDCWYAGPNGPASIILDDVFIPTASSTLTFWALLQLGNNAFSVAVSVDDGNSFIEIFSTENQYDNSWQKYTFSLADFAGQSIRIRFSLAEGTSIYGSGGVWLDDLSLKDTQWNHWMLYQSDLPFSILSYSATTNDWDDCSDFSIFENTSTSSFKDWTVTNLDSRTCFYKEPGGYSNREYHLTSLSTITPSTNTCLLLNLKYQLHFDVFRVLVSTDRSTFTPLWTSALDTATDWKILSISLADYAEQPIYIRLEYLPESGYVSGAVWIDSIKTIEETHPELKGQPLLQTTLSSLPAGTNSFAARISDSSATTHGLGPAMTLSFIPEDSDSDGMPDSWEIRYGLNPNKDDATENPDGDAYDNLSEYICGTDPTDPESCWLLQFQEDPLPVFYGITGRLYTIFYRTNLTAGAWESLAGPLPGSNAYIEVQHYDSPTNAFRYYRVRVEMAP